MILVVIDSADEMDPVRDTSLQILDAASLVSENIYWTTPEHLGWSGGRELSVSIPQAQCFPFEKNKGGLPDQNKELEPKPLHAFSAIYMRKEPPVDTRFLAVTWMLDRAMQMSRKLKVFNHPEALRALNEKAIIFEFPELIQEALICSDAQQLRQFASAFGEHGIVLKPLDGYGGRGVVHLNKEQLEEEAGSYVEEFLSANQAPVIVQPFDPAVFKGEVRVFALHGKIISWCLKVPKENNFLAGTSAGATIEDYSPTQQEEDAVFNVMASLRGRGIEMLGVDMIGGKVSEINITSPRSLFVAERREEVVEMISKNIEKHLKKKA